MVFRIETLSTGRFIIGTSVFFVLLTLFVYWPLWPGNARIMVGCACGDPAQQSWFLGYVPWAVFHGHNPFITNYVDYPRGINVTASTNMPLLGLAFYPVTAFLGATSTYSMLMWLALPLSAISATYATRLWTRSNLGSCIAGLLYGFSPYELHQAIGHLNLAFVPLPPLIFYAVYNVLIRQSGRAPRWGVALGALVSAQFLISSEVAATTVVIASLGAFVCATVQWREMTADRVTFLVQALLRAIGLALVALALPLWYQLFGEYRITTPAQGSISNPYRADLWGAVLPTSQNRFGPASLKAIADHFSNGDVSENSTYLGVPLILLFMGSWARNFRLRWIRLTGFMALACWILSLGPWLVVDAHLTDLRLPFWYLTRVPLLDNILPVRLSLYVIFFVGLTLAICIGTWTSQFQSSAYTRTSQSRFSWVWATAFVLLLLASLASLTPVVPLTTKPTAGAVPSFFSSPTARDIAAGSVLLTYPYVYPNDDQALLWQLKSNFRWKIMGGYFVVPFPLASSDYDGPWPTAPWSVTNYLVYWELHNSPTGMRPHLAAPTLNAKLAEQTRRFVDRYHIDAVVVSLSSSNAARAVALFTDAFGVPRTAGGVDAWLHLSRLTARRTTRQATLKGMSRQSLVTLPPPLNQSADSQ